MWEKDKLSWLTRLRLCWEVFTRGQYDPRDYRTRHQEQQWQICEERRKEMEKCTRPRTHFRRPDNCYHIPNYTDYFERDYNSDPKWKTPRKNK